MIINRRKTGVNLKELTFVIFYLGAASWILLWVLIFVANRSTFLSCIFLILAASCFVLSFIVRKANRHISLRIKRKPDVSDLLSSRGEFSETLRRRFNHLKQAWIPRGILGGVKPPGNITPEKLIFGFFKFAYIVGTPAFLGAILIQLGGREDAGSLAMQTYAVFVFTTIAITLCPGLFVSWFFLFLLSRLNLIECRIRISESVRIMAAWSGSWAAVTLFLGLLGFVLNRPGIDSNTPAGNTEFPLDALVIYPLIGASVGFTAGSVHAVMATTRLLANHVVGVIMPPLILLVTTWGLGRFEFTPKNNASILLRGAPVDEKKLAIGNEDDLINFVKNDPDQFLRLVHQESGDVLFLIPEMNQYLLAVAIVGFIWSFLIHLKFTRSLSIPTQSGLDENYQNAPFKS